MDTQAASKADVTPKVKPAPTAYSKLRSVSELLIVSKPEAQPKQAATSIVPKRPEYPELFSTGPDARRELEPQAHEPPATLTQAWAVGPREVDRISAIWQARRAIIVGTAAIAILVYLLSSIVPSVYSSSATVSVTAASTPGGSAEDVALASNDLAAQDAQLVQSSSVLDTASAALGIPASTLNSHLSAGTVAAQNLIQITTQSSSPATAQRESQEVAVAFRGTLIKQAQANTAALENNINTQAASLNQQISTLQVEIAANQGAGPGTVQLAQVESEENQLTNLLTTRATLTSNTAITVASQQPNVEIVVSGTPATKISPRPTFYALIGGLLALLIACQIAVVVARRRASNTA
jgi:capsular polysaccharide biosynthesis protein